MRRSMTHMHTRWLVRAGALVLCVALVGCSNKGGGGGLATVSGLVTQNGSPIDGAKVTFYSTVEVEGKKGGVFAAQTDSNGKYVIATVGKDPGIPAGLYKVTVAKLETQDGIVLGPDFDRGQLEASGHARNRLPASYESPN